MYFTDHYLIWSLVPVLATFAIIYFYFKWRQHIPKKQICWFCHKEQEVSFDKVNAFDCIHCQQYNGFSEDGNYNKVISAQHLSRTGGHYCRPVADCYSNSVQLCTECNVSQEIKIKLLAQFVPFNEMNFSQECDEYKRHLESEYKLCAECQLRVKDVLSRPINSIRVESTANTSHPKTQNIDSLFINRQTRSRAANWLKFLAISLFEMIGLLCATMLFATGLRTLQDNSIISLIDFSDTATQLMDYYLSDETHTRLILSGLICSLTALVINGKQSVQTTLWLDVFVLLLWLPLIALNSVPQMRLYIRYEEIDSLLLRPILSFFVIIFSTINTSLRWFAFCKRNSKQRRCKTAIKSFQKSTENNKSGVDANGRQEKSFSDNDIKSNKTRDQSIGEQIKSLSIADSSVPALNYRLSKQLRAENNSFAATLHYNQYSSPPTVDTSSYAKSIILPARFNPEPISQTSWVSALQPNTSPLKNNKKEALNSLPFFASSHSLIRTSQWVGHQVSGLMTPPPSATTSVCSDSGFGVNRFQTALNGNRCLSSYTFDNQRNDLSNNTVTRSRLISHQMYSRESSVATNSLESGVSRATGSLPPLLAVQKRTHDCQRHNAEHKPSLSQKLTQNLVLALFLLLLFCFVIFLSLPVVFKTSCDLNSFHFHFTVESLPQNDVCLK